MLVKEIGEKKLVKRIAGRAHSGSNVLIAAGEGDAAVVRAGGSSIVLKSDMMLESTHFPKGIDGYFIGRKVVVANLSDIAAMGAKPSAVLISLGLPGDCRVEKVDRIIRGVNEACIEYGVSFVGGDTKKAKELVVSGAAFGVAGRGEILRRSSARPGDIVAVTGEIGNAALGLEVMQKGMEKKGGMKKFVDAFLMPKARVREGLVIARSRARAAAMDISDGFLYTASEIARMSGVAIRLEMGRIPISKDAVRLCGEIGADCSQLLNGGEDYELLVTIDERRFREVEYSLKKAGGRLIAVGRVANGKGVTLDGKTVKARGYDAFLGKD